MLPIRQLLGQLLALLLPTVLATPFSSGSVNLAVLHDTSPPPHPVVAVQHMGTSESINTPLRVKLPTFDATSPPQDDKPLMMAYYPDWVTDALPPENINFARFDWVDFAFVTVDQQQALIWDDEGKSQDALERLVRSAHAGSTKVKLSIGGWSGSKYFSPAVASDDARNKTVKALSDVYSKFNLDGIDIDWEYPGRDGDSGNVVSPKDSGNFLEFLQLLKKTLPSTAFITAAVLNVPFMGPDREPMQSVVEFSQVLDWVLLMNYDVWGGSEPGPNAPLFNGCNTSSQPDDNAAASVKAWMDAGFPARQIVLGVPSYGYVSNSSGKKLTSRSPNVPRLRQNDEDSCTTGTKRAKGDEDSQIQFRDLVKQGLLDCSDHARCVPSGGFQRGWDKCSATPFLSSCDQVIPYDDPDSLGIKATFAKDMGLRGINIFDLHGDTDDGMLVNACRRGLNLPAVT